MPPTSAIPARAILIGAGGIGMPLASRLPFLYPEGVDVVDGDKYESNNLERQCAPNQVGRPKVYEVPRHPTLVTHQRYIQTPDDLDDIAKRHHTPPLPIHIFVAVDNNAARATILDWARTHADMMIVGANAKTQGEAYVYIPSLSPHILPDPSIVFPAAFHQGAADDASPHCHELEKSDGQLASVNMTVAGDMIFLAQAWENIRQNPSFIQDGLDLPWMINTGLIRKETTYVRYKTP